MPYDKKPAKRKGPPTKNDEIKSKDAEIADLKNKLQRLEIKHTQLETDHEAANKSLEVKKKESLKNHRDAQKYRELWVKFENLYNVERAKYQKMLEQYKKTDYVQANNKLEGEKANFLAQIDKAKEVIAEKDEKITELEELSKDNESIQRNQTEEINVLNLHLQEKDVKLRKATSDLAQFLAGKNHNNKSVPDKKAKALINEIRNNSIAIEAKNFRQIINFYLKEIHNSLNEIIRPNGQRGGEIGMPSARKFISSLQNGEYEIAQHYAGKMEDDLKEKNFWSNDSGDKSVYRTKCPITKQTTAAARLFSDLAKLSEIVRMHRNPTQLTNDYKTANYHTGLETVCLPNQMANQTKFPKPHRTFDQKFLQVSESSGHSSIDVPERADSPSDQTETYTEFEPSEISEITSHITADSVTGEKFNTGDEQSDENSCSICMTTYGDKMELPNAKGKKVLCKKVNLHLASNGDHHHFCRICLDKWNSQQSSGTTGQTRCPTCNMNVVDDSSFPALS